MSKTTEEILAEFEEKKAAMKTDETLDDLFEAAAADPRASTLERVWRSSVLRRNEGKFYSPWTSEDKGKVSQAVKAVGGRMMALVLREAGEHWDSLTAYLRKEAGHDKVGGPSIRLLVYHREHAVNWTVERASACAKKKPEGLSWDLLS